MKEIFHREGDSESDVWRASPSLEQIKSYIIHHVYSQNAISFIRFPLK